jgi:short-subunit dehydrogenase
MSELRGRRALVTGASSGLGADFARVLAEQGCHLVLVARRADRLEALAKELRERHGVQVESLAMSLSEPEAAAALHQRMSARGVEIDVLVNNAGFGVFGEFLSVPWEREREMLQLDVLAVVQLTKLFGAEMVKRGRGWILQVASIGFSRRRATASRPPGLRALVRRGAFELQARVR